jgi:hypothetical protein
MRFGILLHNEKQKISHRQNNSKMKYQNRRKSKPPTHKYMTAHYTVLAWYRHFHKKWIKKRLCDSWYTLLCSLDRDNGRIPGDRSNGQCPRGILYWHFVNMTFKVIRTPSWLCYTANPIKWKPNSVCYRILIIFQDALRYKHSL